MIDSTTFLGAPRLRILNTDLSTTIKTLYLPFTDLDAGIVVQDIPAKGIRQDLLSGAVRYIPGGVRHNVTLTYGLYDPLYFSKQMGKTVGTADGNVPELAQLYDLITTYNVGRLSISPCTNQEVWFRCACTSQLQRQTIYPAGFGQISLVFEGLDVYGYTTSTTVIG